MRAGQRFRFGVIDTCSHSHLKLPPFAKNAKDWAPSYVLNGREIKSLGHPPPMVECCGALRIREARPNITNGALQYHHNPTLHHDGTATMPGQESAYGDRIWLLIRPDHGPDRTPDEERNREVIGSSEGYLHYEIRMILIFDE